MIPHSHSIVAVQTARQAITGCLLWVKSGKARPEHLTSAFHLITDLLQTSREVRFVPKADLGRIEASERKPPWGGDSNNPATYLINPLDLLLR